MEGDDSLRENITELLELEGYQITSVAPSSAKSVFQNYQPGIAILNELTLSQPIDESIRFLKDKVDGIVVLCSDVDDPQLLQADIKIPLPFDYKEFEEQISGLMNHGVLFEA